MRGNCSSWCRRREGWLNCLTAVPRTIVRRITTQSAGPTKSWMLLRAAASGTTHCRTAYHRTTYPAWHTAPPECLEGRPCLLALTVASPAPRVQIPRLAPLARDDRRRSSRAERAARSRRICTHSDLSKGGPNQEGRYANPPTSACVYSRTAVRRCSSAPHSGGPPTESWYVVRWYDVR